MKLIVLMAALTLALPATAGALGRNLPT